jgi:hypothetical protein
MVAVPTSAFNITKGTPKSFTTIGNDSGKQHPRFFCESEFTPPFSIFCEKNALIYVDCGSSLYSRPESMPGVTVIRAGGLDDGADDIAIGVEFFAKNRKGFVHAVDGAKQAKTMS